MDRVLFRPPPRSSAPYGSVDVRTGPRVSESWVVGRRPVGRDPASAGVGEGDTGLRPVKPRFGRSSRSDLFHLSYFT